MLDSEILQYLKTASPEQVEEVIATLPDDAVAALLAALGTGSAIDLQTPLEQARVVDDGYLTLPHLSAVSSAIAEAVKDVEAGKARRLIIQMPPRSGKSYLSTQIAPLWCLQRQPGWNIALTSHDGTLAAQWGRQVRRWVEQGRAGAVKIAPDAGAVKEWETTGGGGVLSRSIRESFTGRGAKVLVIDDPHKDFVEAHSTASREAVWNWWLTVAQTRLEPASLVIVVMTRWHEDDLVGRLLSPEYEGDPDQWQVLRLPAIAEKDDLLGREQGEPLYSPLIRETRQEALERWAEVKQSVGSYVWSALYQQRPAPAKGNIFSTDWWRFWTTDPALASRDAEGNIDPHGKTVLLDPEELAAGSWLDSWDMRFKEDVSSGDYVVGQRWVLHGANRYLIAQQRGRWGFTKSIEAMERWAKDDPLTSPYGRYVHKRLVEEAANGAAIIETLKKKISGIVPVTARVSKQARAWSVSPEIESGNVYLPHPDEPGNEWVKDLLSELRNFPNDTHDDQVDALTQALGGLRDSGSGGLTMPGASERRTGSSAISFPAAGIYPPGGNRLSAARTMRRRI